MTNQISKLFIGIGLLLFSQHVISASLAQDTSNVLKAYDFDFAFNENIYCAPPNQKFKTDYPHADYLLNVASAANVVVFIHGFLPTRPTGKQSLDEMVKDWRYHIDILDDLKGSAAYCVLTWDSEYGYDDKDRTLAKFLTAINFAARDERLDARTKSLTLVGHSAGGNYIKYSYLDFLVGNGKVKNIVGNPLTKNFKIKIITMATPHLGAEIVDKTSSNIFLLSLVDAFIGKGSVLAHKANSRGVKQLRTIEFNDALYKINKTFRKVFPRGDIHALGSDNDEHVSLNSSKPDFTTHVNVHGVTHSGFLQPYKISGLRDFLTKLYASR